MSGNQVVSSKSEQTQESEHQKRAMTLRICPQLTTFVVLMLAVSLSTRISEEVRRGSILSSVTRFTYLFAFGTWLGIQFWATFIAGMLSYIFLIQSSCIHVRFYGLLLADTLQLCNAFFTFDCPPILLL